MDQVRCEVDRANPRVLAIRLVMSYIVEDTTLHASGYFRPWHVQPFLGLYDVTLQTLLNVFSVSGVVHYGTAGSCNDPVSFGNVSVPK
ncbi:bark storage protein A-like [Hordeum vulgare]|nr:bark storage protein A-like [Hordeum vulgare]